MFKLLVEAIVGESRPTSNHILIDELQLASSELVFEYANSEFRITMTISRPDIMYITYVLDQTALSNTCVDVCDLGRWTIV